MIVNVMAEEKAAEAATGQVGAGQETVFLNSYIGWMGALWQQKGYRFCC